jgi:hypothetical protein
MVEEKLILRACVITIFKSLDTEKLPLRIRIIQAEKTARGFRPPELIKYVNCLFKEGSVSQTLQRVVRWLVDDELKVWEEKEHRYNLIKYPEICSVKPTESTQILQDIQSQGKDKKQDILFTKQECHPLYETEIV